MEWRDGSVRLIDQRRLPEDLTFIEVTTVEDMCEAISTLAVRGAPALGVAGAMGVALAANLGQDIQAAASRIVDAPYGRESPMGRATSARRERPHTRGDGHGS